jgi:checkpoint serine/threonine-protein kinase
LTSSFKGAAVSNSVGGADLMLVDFGRSIDLSCEAVPGSDPLETQFTGSIAAEDMECGSMRDGTSWGIELDLFGLAASSYILLFGSHMEVMKDRSTGKWRPNKPFRRYWQQELWSPLFDSLLNFDSTAYECCLHDHIIAFTEYIEWKQRRKEISTHLNQLYTHLPKQR